MSRSRSLSTYLTGQEMLSAIVYLVLQLFALPSLLRWVNAQLAAPLNDAELNFVFYLVNFMAMLLIFHDYLSRSTRQATQHPGQFCEAVILGLVAYYACSYVTNWIISLLVPNFTNYNDEAIAAMRNGNAFLVLIGTVVLVPPFEECMYRGLIFRSLYRKNRVMAYILSMVIFAMIHILGYLGTYSPLELLMAVLQYLPAGLCLAWTYVRGDTILSSIVVHAAINYITIKSLL